VKVGDDVVLASKQASSSFGQAAFVLVPWFRGVIGRVTTDGLEFVDGSFAPFVSFDLAGVQPKEEKKA
jgi:hypothetical protein